MPTDPPDWVAHAVFYQVFPDRFARSLRTPHPRGLTFKPWGSPPAEQGFQGGDLYGIIDRLDYLKALGITALYLNPIFASAATHRYHTFDYFEVDPLLGGNAALRALLDAAHARDLRIVLDGVFNHASRGFWPFHHILENGGNSPYLDWFIVHQWPLRPYASDAANPPNYAAWWNLPALPKLNTANPGVRDYLFDVARHWVDFGIDGWRLDVANEIDQAFWRQFRSVVKDANPEAYIVGEIWGDARAWLQGDQFDAVMNYLFTAATLSFFGAETLRPGYARDDLPLRPLDAAAFDEALQALLALYAPAVNRAQLNLLDSHDTARALWIMGDDVRALRLSVLFQMTMPGAPCIYYGDEIGLSAGDDPHCRGAFPWHDEGAWDTDLLGFYRQATALRHAHPVLRTGAFRGLLAEGRCYAFARTDGTDGAVVAFNAGTTSATLSLDVRALPPKRFVQAWPPETTATYHADQGRLPLALPARSAAVLVGTASDLPPAL